MKPISIADIMSWISYLIIIYYNNLPKTFSYGLYKYCQSVFQYLSIANFVM